MVLKKQANFSDDSGAASLCVILNALEKGCIKGYEETKHLATQNSLPSRKWDRINSEIDSVCATSKTLFAHKIRRGCWHLLLVYNSEIGVLYGIMRNNRLNELLKNFGDNVCHYIPCLAALLNEEVTDQSISLFEEVDEEILSKKHSVAQSILRDVGEDNIKKFMVIAFDEHGGTLEKAELKILNIVGDIVYDEVLFDDNINYAESVENVEGDGVEKESVDFEPTTSSDTLTSLVQLKLPSSMPA